MTCLFNFYMKAPFYKRNYGLFFTSLALNHCGLLVEKKELNSPWPIL
jgi:hypothetical protein